MFAVRGCHTKGSASSAEAEFQKASAAVAGMEGQPASAEKVKAQQELNAARARMQARRHNAYLARVQARGHHAYLASTCVGADLASRSAGGSGAGGSLLHEEGDQLVLVRRRDGR